MGRNFKITSVFQPEKALATLANMANKEHLAKLQEGVEAWNTWRKQNPNIQPDLSRVNLGKVDLRGVDLRDANLDGVNLCEANLSEASFGWADLQGADLRRVDLVKADLDGADLRGADLSGANLSKANFGRANLFQADLHRVNLTEADLHEADLREADLREADLREVNLYRAHLSRAELRGAELNNVDLGQAKLYWADLREANLGRVYLDWADLYEADLSGANLASVNFSKTDLSRANFASAKLWETVFANVNLTNVEGLDSCEHHGPSSIDYHTLEQSGNLPLSFLRGCGLPDIFIDYLPSLLNQPIQHYSCFISYSSKDEALAQRLHADLQDKGVRCWFAPEDLKIGDKFRVRIDEAIRTYKKLLLLLSEHSMASTWVENEVETAFEKEDEHKESVLFPIRLDAAVMESKTGWAAAIRRTRHIGNFSNWKNHDDYQKGLERLLRDLQIEKD